MIKFFRMPGNCLFSATIQKCFLLLVVVLFSLKLSAQPVINSFSPTSGPVGTTVTITGNNFSATPGNNIVFFGAVKATVTSSTATFLTVTVPAGATYQPISITVNGLTAYSTNSFIVTFTGGVLGSASFEYATNADDVIGLETNDLSITDMDSDGKPDLIVADNLNGFFAFYKNTSSGSAISFGPRISYQAGKKPQRIAVGDIDGDGKPDVAVANTDDNNISVFRNTTTGGVISFAPKINFVAGTNCIGICMSDFDLDGKPDLATISTNLNGTVTTLRNTSTLGVISFASKVDFDVNGVLSTITASDINSDGKADLIVTNLAANVFGVLRNTSAADSISFASGTGFTTGPYPDRLVTGDMDGDGKNDIAITYFNSSYASVYRNTSSGSAIAFTPRADYAATNPGSPVIADLDGDSKSDLALLNDFESITLFKNNSVSGNISFSSVGSFTSLGSRKIMACDFNADGKSDLAELRGTFRVSVWRNETTEPQITSFSPATSGSGTTITITGANFTGVTSVSFGGTPAASFTVVNSNTITAAAGSGTSGVVSVSAPHGIGTKDGYTFVPNPVITSFTPTTGITGLSITITGTNLSGATAVRFGGVPAASFTVVNDTKITAIVGAGNSGDVGVTTPGGTATIPGFTYIPKPDIISFSPITGTIGTTVTITGANFIGATDVRFGNIPAGSFTVVSSTTISATVLGGSSGSVKVTSPGGSDTLAGFIFLAPPAPKIISFSPASGSAGTMVTITGNNFNTDIALNFVYFGAMRATVVSATSTTLTVTVPAGATSQSISVTTNHLTAYAALPFIVTFPGGGNISSNSFEGPLNFATEAGPLDVIIADIDGDGKNDLLTTTVMGPGITVLKNTTLSGTISFLKSDYYGGFNAYKIIAAEIDGDGKKDIVTVSTLGREFTVLKNNSVPGTVTLEAIPDYNLTREGYEIQTGDFDGDGKTDLVIGCADVFSVIRNTSVVNNISFATRVDFPATYYNSSISVGDVDGDSKPDIVYLNASLDTVYIRRNTTSGGVISFAGPVKYVLANNPTLNVPHYDVKLSDIDRDGKLDLLIPNNDVIESISVYRNTSSPGTVSFQQRVDFATGPPIGPSELAAEDMDGDGIQDILFSHDYVPVTGCVIKNNSTTGTMAFAPHVAFTNKINTHASGICAGDLDGDNKPELIVSGGIGVEVYKNRTDGPHITSFSPGNGIAGTSIIITGSNFNGATSVSFGGRPAASFTVNSSNSITAVLGEGAAGEVSVSTALGTVSVPGFLYGLAPTITSFTPISGATGAIITITGVNFTGATAVNFGGQRALFFTVVSPTTIIATVGSGVSGEVFVTVPGGTDSLQGFIYIPPAPVISSFAPLSGGPGTVVSIWGSNFTGATNVSFGGMPASSFTLLTPSVMTAVVGPGATGSVSVTTSGGTGSKSGFTYIETTITSFTPTSAAKGTIVTIAGTNFKGATAVSFGGIAASSFTVVNATTITAVVSAGASGTVSVTTPVGTAMLGGFTFISAPTITSFTPSSGGTGAYITITGTNFIDATAVSFGGVAASSFTVNSSTSITAIVGTGASGNVSVTTSGGSAALAGFTFIPKPTITSFTPASGGTGASVTINGINFTGATAVSFGGIAATSFTVNSSTSITATVGTGASGNVSLTTLGGSAALAGFTFMSSPTITSFTPAKGRSGVTVIITGTNFNETTAVSFGGVSAASFTINSSTSISAVVGTGASGDITVTTPYGTATAGEFAFEAGRGVNELVIYPNPADEFIMVKHPSTDLSAQLKVIDLAGKVVKVVVPERNASETRIDLRGLKQGIYQVVWSDGRQKVSQKLMFYN